MKHRVFPLLLLSMLLTGCADPQWDVDSASTSRVWTTGPDTKNFGRVHACYEFHDDGTVTAYVTPASFPFPFHIENGRSGKEIGDYGNWVQDITFHGVTERYWGHYAYAPDWRAVLTVVPDDYKPNPKNTPGAGGIMYPSLILPVPVKR
jgi:hypothetical protein